MPIKTDLDFTLLRIYAYYRTLLSCLLLLMFSSGIVPNVLGADNPSMFRYTAIIYTAICIATLIFLWARRFILATEPLFAILFIDIVALIFFSYTSGGVIGGLGVLMLVTCAAGGIFFSTQLCTVLAAISSLLAITETLYVSLHGQGDGLSTFNAGILGIMLFAAALTFNYLSLKLRANAEEAAIQAHKAKRLAKMAQMIVEKMQTGVVVTAQNGDIDLMNRSAERLLNWPKDHPQHRIDEIPELEAQVKLWQSTPESRGPSMKIRDKAEGVRLNFAELSPGNQTETLIFVEDNRALDSEAQQLKLASLGRLTASIAHEIRNPLGAISHASQLLAESENINNTDLRLTEIISTHCHRVNQIIENILALSSRGASRPELIDLAQWLPSFINNYHDIDDNNQGIKLQLQHTKIMTKMDPSHLHQVLSNLIDNGMRYSKLNTGNRNVLMRAGINADNELPFIEVIDEGPGIAEDIQDKIFEPFYTTESTGSGLGLYLSKELCRANYANIHYRFDHNNKSCFTIVLSHPNRVL